MQQDKMQVHCPFYGLSWRSNLEFRPTSGNQCALFTDSHVPCQMEVNGMTPRWRGCPFNNRGTRHSLLECGVRSAHVTIRTPRGDMCMTFAEHLARTVGEQYRLTDD